MNHLKVSEEGRAKALSLWGSDFWFRFRNNDAIAAGVRVLLESIVAKEADQGPIMLGEELILPESSPPLFIFGRVAARKWSIPITQYGLLAAILGCRTPNHVLITLAALQLKFMHRYMNRSDNFLDSLFVSEVMNYGTPNEDFYDLMWELQQVQAGVNGTPKYNLLDYVTEKDFRTPMAIPA